MTILLGLMKICFWLIGFIKVVLWRIYLSEQIDLTKNNNSKECMFCHYWFFNHDFNFQDYVCNGCHDLLMLCVNISDNAIVTVKGADYYCIIHDNSKSGAINLLKNSVLENRGYIQKCISKKSLLKMKSISIILTICSKQKN